MHAPVRRHRTPARGLGRGAVIGVATVVGLFAPFTRVASFVSDTASLTSGRPVAVRQGVPTSLIPGLVLTAQESSQTPFPAAALGTVPMAASDSLTAIPAAVYAAYRVGESYTAGAYPGCHLSWSVLAGIGAIESHHALAGGSARPGWDGTAVPPIFGPTLDGRLAGTARVSDTDGGVLDGDSAYDRAVGPLQFLPSTWSAYAVDANGDGRADPQNIVDASATAGLYLCASGADLSDPRQLVAALGRYNHSDSYVRAVLAASSGYLAASLGASQLGVAQAAIAFAYARLGDPYLWGGTGPLYDCSGLTQAAYRSAGVNIPRTAEQQWQQLPKVLLSDLLPGDLVFSSPGEFLPGLPGHVGIYLGAGLVLNDPHTGAVVRIDTVQGLGPLVGAARPSMLTTYPGAPSPGTGFVLPPVIVGVPAPSTSAPGPVPRPAPVPSLPQTSATPTSGIVVPTSSPTGVPTVSGIPTTPAPVGPTTDQGTAPTSAPVSQPSVDPAASGTTPGVNP